MLPDALPQLIDTLLRLPRLEAAQLRELLRHLPDPETAAREMVARGWITQGQFSSLSPEPEQQPASRETVLVGLPNYALPFRLAVPLVTNLVTNRCFCNQRPPVCKGKMQRTAV